jgi:protein O-mannosyl-transferase
MKQNKIKTTVNTQAKIFGSMPQTSTNNIFSFNYLIAIIPAIFAILLYANTFKHGYVLDDYPSIVNNEFVQKGFAGIPSILKVDFWYFSNLALGYYRPFSIITFAIEHQLFGANPHLSHVINVLLYSLTAFMLGLLMQILFKQHKAILWLAVCLIFVCHPIHTEVVANLKSRDEILSFLGIISAMFLAIRSQETGKRWQLILACTIYYIGFMSKESAITLLALLPLSYYFLLQKSIGQAIIKTLPFVIVMFLFYIQKNQIIPTPDPDMFLEINNYPYQDTKFPSGLMLFVYIIKMLFLPYPLRYDYSFNQIPIADFTSPLTWLGLALFLAAIIFSVLKMNKRYIFAFIAASFLATCLPALGFVWLRGGIFAERFLYASVWLFGLFIVFGLAFIFKHSLMKNENEREMTWFSSITSMPMIMGILGLLCLIFGIQTIARNPIWKSNETLTQHDLVYTQASAQANKHYGTTLMQKALDSEDTLRKIKLGNESLVLLKRAIAINPMFGEAWELVGRYYMDIQYNADSAIYYYKNTIMATPKSAIAAFNMAVVYYKIGKLKLASYYFNRAIMANPNFLEARNNSASLKQSTGLDVRILPCDEDPSGFDPPGPKVIEY